MKEIAKYTAALFLCLLAACCTKSEEQKEKAPIVFCIDDGLDVSQTKAAITDDNLQSSTVKVYATKDAQKLGKLSPGVIEPKRVFWGPAETITWDDGHAYTFLGYAYMPANNTRFPSIDDEGLSFTVQQPTSYSSEMADYVISSKVVVSDEESRAHPLIVLEFEHVLPAVRVYVTSSPSLGDRSVEVTKMTLSGLLCRAELKFQDSSWIPSYPSISKGTYTVQNLSVGHDWDNTEARLDIISVPQQLPPDSKLTIQYKVDEGVGGSSIKSHSQTFNLIDYVTTLEGGHRTVLHVSIDTGIHLQATIAEWKHVDFIEGTVLPPIEKK